MDKINLNWNCVDITDIRDILNFINRFHYRISNVTLNQEKQTSFIDFTSDKIIEEQKYILIPNLMTLIEGKIHYGIIKKFELKKFPTVLAFIDLYSPHIKEFIIDQKIEFVLISSITIFNYNNSSDIAFNFEKANKKIEILQDSSKVNSLILVELIKKFYNGQDYPKYSNPLYFSNHRHMNTIVSENNLMNRIIVDPLSVLRAYKVSVSSDCISYSSYVGMHKFSFADIEYFSTSNIEPYKNFMEIKLLDYIAQR